MKIISQQGNHFILRGERGQDLKQNLLDFCKEHDIKAGWFTGLGACNKATLAYYDLDSQKYVDKIFEGQHEITNITGNISTYEDEIIVHAHATIANTNYEASAGHVQEMVISGTAEIHLEYFKEEVSRKLEDETGLTILNKS